MGHLISPYAFRLYTVQHWRSEHFYWRPRFNYIFHLDLQLISFAYFFFSQRFFCRMNLILSDCRLIWSPSQLRVSLSLYDGNIEAIYDKIYKKNYNILNNFLWSSLGFMFNLKKLRMINSIYGQFLPASIFYSINRNRTRTRRTMKEFEMLKTYLVQPLKKMSFNWLGGLKNYLKQYPYFRKLSSQKLDLNVRHVLRGLRKKIIRNHLRNFFNLSTYSPSFRNKRFFGGFGKGRRRNYIKKARVLDFINARNAEVFRFQKSNNLFFYKILFNYIKRFEFSKSTKKSKRKFKTSRILELKKAFRIENVSFALRWNLIRQDLFRWDILRRLFSKTFVPFPITNFVLDDLSKIPEKERNKFEISDVIDNRIRFYYRRYILQGVKLFGIFPSLIFGNQSALNKIVPNRLLRGVSPFMDQFNSFFAYNYKFLNTQNLIFSSPLSIKVLNNIQNHFLYLMFITAYFYRDPVRLTANVDILDVHEEEDKEKEWQKKKQEEVENLKHHFNLISKTPDLFYSMNPREKLAEYLLFRNLVVDTRKNKLKKILNKGMLYLNKKIGKGRVFNFFDARLSTLLPEESKDYFEVGSDKEERLYLRRNMMLARNKGTLPLYRSFLSLFDNAISIRDAKVKYNPKLFKRYIDFQKKLGRRHLLTSLFPFVDFFRNLQNRGYFKKILSFNRIFINFYMFIKMYFKGVLDSLRPVLGMARSFPIDVDILLFCNPTARFIVQYIKIKLSQKFYVKSIIYPIMSSILRDYADFDGARLECTGRFKRRGRAKRYVLGRGTVALSTVTKSVDYFQSFVALKHGIVGIRFWISWREGQVGNALVFV